jgi:hypothetical protein
MTGNLTSTGFIKTGGTSSQFLKADGSVDSSTYLTAESDTLDSVTDRGASTTNDIGVGNVTATSFIKSGGLSSQFLKANGSVDSNAYITAESDTLDSVTDRGAVTTNTVTVGDFNAQASSLNSLSVVTTSSFTGDAAFDTDTLFVDVSADRVGVNIAVPTEALDVVGNIKASGSVSGLTLGGTLSTAAQPNVTSVGTLSSLAVSGGITGNLTGNVSGNLTGSVLTAAQTNVTSVGTLSSLAVSGNLTVDTNTLFVDAANNNVGIGTSSPTVKLDVNGSLAVSGGADITGSLRSFDGIIAGNSSVVGIKVISITPSSTSTPASIQGAHAGVGAYDITLQASGGNVGIGTSSPSDQNASANNLVIEDTAGSGGITIKTPSNAFGSIHFSDGTGIDAYRGFLNYEHSTDIMNFGIANNTRVSITPNGLTFNGDTAAANALDDYEEGTWTIGVDFGGAAVGVTYGSNTGTYTKIGRQVTVNGIMGLSSKGSSTGSARLTGLPFTVPNNGGHYSAPSFWLNNIRFANQYQAIPTLNGTSVALYEITEAGAVSTINDTEFENSSEIIISFTYFV